MGMCADPGSYRWCQALSRSRSSFATKQKTNTKTTTTATHQQQRNHIDNTRKISKRTTTTILETLNALDVDSYNNSSNNNSNNNTISSRTPLRNHQQQYEQQPQSTKSIINSTSSTAPAAFGQQHHQQQQKLRSFLLLSHKTLHIYRELLSLRFLITLLILVILAQRSYAGSGGSGSSSSSSSGGSFRGGSNGSGSNSHSNNNNQLNNIPEDAVHITAILGEGVIFNCHVEFPNDHPVPYVLQWDKKVSETGSDLPIYIWYESYPEHIEEGYKGRVSRVSPDSPFGSASLNLTNIKESDQGWYECKVVFLNRDPKQHKNGTWFHLDVHAPPRFSVTPEDIIYVNLGDSIILNCQADGTPTPEILWYKDANPVDPSPTVGIFNDGTELRISTIRHEDIGEYTCIARNGEGQVSHTARVIIAGGAVIMSPTSNVTKTKTKTKTKTIPSQRNGIGNGGIRVPPTNQTKLEGEKVIFTCEAKAMPGNVTVRWFREGSPVHEIASLESRVTIRKDGSLIINPVAADDSGQYLCEVTNGIGDPQSASAYLSVEYPAKVTFTPTVQYLPFRLAGVVQCYIKSNPQLQYVTWTKDKRLLEPYQMKDIVVMSNGSLLFTHVHEDHQGRYTCTPHNAQGTQGASGPMEVLVRKPPSFTVEPESLYQRKVGDSVEMHCDAVEAEGTSKPTITWQRQDGAPLSETQRVRTKISGGNLTIENLRREDFGYYQCVVANEVATLMTQTQLVIEGTQPHAPYNITGKATESSITLNWMPGYSGGSEYKQDYTIWYREAGTTDWQTISVTPSGSTEVTINGLASGTTYEFQVVGRNILGDGMMSKVMTVRTLEDAPAAPRNVKAATQPPDHVFQLMPDDADLLAPFDIYFHTDYNGSIVYSPPKLKMKGPKPGPPRNVTVTEISNGFLITWQAPLERAHIVKFYTIKYRTDAQWKTLNRGQIRPEETQYLVKNLVGGRTYYFRVLANSEKSYESSDEVKFPVPARVKHKAITAGVVGGILFFIVAIILSVCAVKICNKRKRRKQEKEFNMVACRITDARNIVENNAHLRSRSTGSMQSSGQVPLKKYKQTGISSLTAVLIAILHWIWPPDRCNNCHSIYSSPHLDDSDGSSTQRRRSVSQIQRSGDGRFVLGGGKEAKFGVLTIDEIDARDSSGGGGGGGDGADEVDAIDERRQSNASRSSSSDDGGFLSRRSFITARASWRRPLVASPSQLSLQSAADSARGFLQSVGQGIGQGINGLLRFGGVSRGGGGGVDEETGGARYQNVYRHHYGQNIYRNLQPAQPMQSTNHPLHINTISGALGGGDHVGALGQMPHPHHSHMHQHGLGAGAANLYTPGKVSRIFSSSPASTPSGGNILLGSNVNYAGGAGPGNGAGLLTSPWTMTTPNGYYHQHFNDLSSVYPSSAERSFPTPTASGNLSRYRYYTHELPSLRTIQEETRRLNQREQQRHEFVPLQIPSPPSWRSYYYTHTPYHSYRPRTRWYPRHYSRLFGRSQAELLSPLPHLNMALRGGSGPGTGMGLEASPESRSSSSGFGSKNTSNHPHGSHHSGSTSEWRLLPPYRPPPPPPATSAYFGTLSTQSQQAQAQQQAASAHHVGGGGGGGGGYTSATLPYYNYTSSSLQRPITPPYTIEHWLDMITRLNAATDGVNMPKSVDVGSVDGHYEFDPSTPTPSASTPTGGLLRDDFNLHIDTTGHHTVGPIGGGIFHTHTSGMPPLSGAATYGGPVRKLRSSRYDNVEVRLQAMKEEFYAYRKRQAMQRAGVSELESVC